MEMAQHIMSILKAKLMVVWSWGFNSPMAIPNGLRFKVQGFKFRGVVDVVMKVKICLRYHLSNVVRLLM